LDRWRPRHHAEEVLKRRETQMRSDIGARKIAEAKRHLADATKEQNKAAKTSQKVARRDQTTKLNIAGGYRNPLLHKTSFQKDLQASPDYIVPKQARGPKAAKSTTK
jgi:hypothetical protein